VVHDIAWAPVMGRSYHLIATASRENCFRVRQRYSRRLKHEYILIALLCHLSFHQIHKLRRKEDGSLEYDKTQTVHTKDGSAVWRVSWNTTGMLPLFSYSQLLSTRMINAFSSILFAGTVLATSAEDGLLSLYRKDFSGSWINVQTLPSRAEPTKAFFKNS
jgi:hypothetical protein